MVGPSDVVLLLEDDLDRVVVEGVPLGLGGLPVLFLVDAAHDFP